MGRLGSPKCRQLCYQKMVRDRDKVREEMDAGRKSADKFFGSIEQGTNELQHYFLKTCPNKEAVKTANIPVLTSLLAGAHSL